MGDTAEIGIIVFLYTFPSLSYRTLPVRFLYIDSDTMAQEYDAVVIGAGFAGIFQLKRLRDDLGLKCLVRIRE